MSRLFAVVSRQDDLLDGAETDTRDSPVQRLEMLREKSLNNLRRHVAYASTRSWHG